MCAVSVLIAIFAPTKHGEVGIPTLALPKGGDSARSDLQSDRIEYQDF